MIKIENASKRLESFRLHHISLEIPKGYICGLVGQNGAGKTSLLNVILGLYKAEEGTVEVFGKTYEDNRIEILDQIGTVLVDDYFEENLSLLDNAEMFGKYYTKYKEDKFINYLEKFGLLDLKREKYKKISKGQKLKFQFAFALAHEPKLLILDEPTGNFDPDFRKEFFQSISEFMADGEKSVILATHLTEDLDRLADYLLYIENGEMVFQGDIETFRESYRVLHGEKYKINLLPKENVIYMEESEYDTKALVKHCHRNDYGQTMKVVYPTIEEFMYYYSKRNKRTK